MKRFYEAFQGAKFKKDLQRAELFEEAVHEGAKVTNNGALVIYTNRTGRSANDKFFVKTQNVENEIAWGKINKPMSEKVFWNLAKRISGYVQARPLYTSSYIAGRDESHEKVFDIITDKAIYQLFADQLLTTLPEEKRDQAEDFTILMVSSFKCFPEIDKTNSDAVIAINLDERFAIIAGTEYCGELKKTVFTVMNYLLPQEGVLPLHCSANADIETNETKLILGLSGTGKTTLSATPDTELIGDDEHGWSSENIFNIEGGCYAKIIGLKQSREPEIYRATNRFCTVIENAIFKKDLKGHPTHDIDFFDNSITENTRAGYSLEKIKKSVKSGVGHIPSAVVFLTADAYGVLPPVSKLDSKTAAFYYLSGYTSKMPGTEVGITEPVTTFSSFFGEPFFPLKEEVYANMFIEKLEKHNIPVFLVNTGWVGPSEKRIDLSFTRKIMSNLSNYNNFKFDERFKLYIPTDSPEYDPINSWDDKAEYERRCKKLAGKFISNFRDKFPKASSILQAGPSMKK